LIFLALEGDSRVGVSKVDGVLEENMRVRLRDGVLGVEEVGDAFFLTFLGDIEAVFGRV
jgi:hypothetical protein